ncbi:MAG TPA: hypothetical protein VMT34_11285 [Aggregatilineales bacterium]|nr:hypothetical protein [Aggregatilineales bacterium]
MNSTGLTSLNTYGAVLSFAIELEGALQRFYESAAPVAGDHEEQFEDYARTSAKRKQRLIGIRQDNVTEIVLEPITGLNGANYSVASAPPTSAAEALTAARRIEARAQQFYLDSGPKLNVTEPRRAFQKLAQENAERLNDLGEQ